MTNDMPVPGVHMKEIMVRQATKDWGGAYSLIPAALVGTNSLLPDLIHSQVTSVIHPFMRVSPPRPNHFSLGPTS
jgi:hypothetical protein